jgi:hypothetical protein
MTINLACCRRSVFVSMYIMLAVISGLSFMVFGEILHLRNRIHVSYALGMFP